MKESNSKLMCLFWNRTKLVFWYKCIGLAWNVVKLYPTLDSYFFLHTVIVLYCFHWHNRQLKRGVKCTRRPFKWWRNMPNSKPDVFFWKGRTKLSFGYKCIGLVWNVVKLYPTLDSYFFLHTVIVLYCFHWHNRQLEGVLSVHGGLLNDEGICQIQNWCVFLKGEN